MRTCAREQFSVSSYYDGKTCIATPTRHFVGTGAFQKCDLYGKEFKNSEEAHAAMLERGYSEPYFRRVSVPIETFRKLDHHLQSCKFDALYRLFKWQQRQKQSSLSLSMKPHHVLKAKLQRMAKRVCIFHPVARVFNSPRCARYIYRYGTIREEGPMEISLIGIPKMKSA